MLVAFIRTSSKGFAGSENPQTYKLKWQGCPQELQAR